MKINKKMMVITSLICLLPLIAGAIVYNKVPDTIVTHWDGEGIPNGYSSKFVGLFVFPGSLFFLNLVFPFLIKMDPKNENMDGKVISILQWIIPLVDLSCSGATIIYALGKNINVPFSGTVLVGLVMIIIGNYMPKMSQSYTVGIKIPWTLSDSENWDKTHRVAGYSFVAGGVLILLTAFVPGGSKLMVPIIFSMVFGPVIYSYCLYRKKIKKNNKDITNAD